MIGKLGRRDILFLYWTLKASSFLMFHLFKKKKWPTSEFNTLVCCPKTFLYDFISVWGPGLQGKEDNSQGVGKTKCLVNKCSPRLAEKCFSGKKFSPGIALFPVRASYLNSFRQLRGRPKALFESVGPWLSSAGNNLHGKLARSGVACPEPHHLLYSSAIPRLSTWEMKTYPQEEPYKNVQAASQLYL